MFIEAGDGNMRASTSFSSRPGGWSFSASLGFHVLIGLALLLAVTPRWQPPSPDDSVSVDVLTQQQFEAASSPPVTDAQAGPVNGVQAKPVAENPAPDFTPLPTDRQPPGKKVMIPAAHLQSAKILADPRSAKARKALGQLVSSERIVQLCNIEAMEQVALWDAALKPDFLVAYAMGDITLSGQKLTADGGAFRSKGRWYNIGFTCDVTADLKQVLSFAFAVGSEIPRGEWADHNLSADDGPAD